PCGQPSIDGGSLRRATAHRQGRLAPQELWPRLLPGSAVAALFVATGLVRGQVLFKEKAICVPALPP
ncbi:MAG TPA: hypothetical protein VEI29_06620, partial [Burkholderiaceae bacterium]|nr:hypothetical protein [Burkholderiaceae bacterium]